MGGALLSPRSSRPCPWPTRCGPCIEGTKVAITTPAKTVADCFKFRNRIGTDVAIEALKELVRRHPGEIDALLRHAKVDRVERVIRPYLESVA